MTTAGVTQTSATATVSTPGGNRNARSADNCAFGEALIANKARPGQAEATAKTKTSGHHWRQEDDVSAADCGAELRLADASELEVGDDILDAVDPDTSEEIGTEANEKEEDASFPAQMKAEQAISAMMAMAPIKQHSPAVDPAAAEIDDAGVASRSSGANKDLTIGTASDPFGEQLRVRLGSVEAGAETRLSASATETATFLSSATSLGRRSVTTAEPTVASTKKNAGESKIGSEGKDARHAAPPTGSAEAKLAAEDAVPVSLTLGAGETGGGGGNSDGSGSRNTPRGRGEPVAAKVSVLSQQMAPAPAAVPGLSANAAAIVSALDADLGWRPASASSAQSAQALKGTQPMRSLKIQLHPAELGMVTANLKTSGEQLSVELQVDNQEAYHRLSADSDAIVKSLRSLGYDIDRVSVQQPQAASASVARSDASADAGSFSRDASSFQPGSSGSGGERFGGQASGRGHGSGTEHTDQAQAMHQNRTGGGLYI